MGHCGTSIPEVEVEGSGFQEQFRLQNEPDLKVWGEGTHISRPQSLSTEPSLWSKPPPLNSDSEDKIEIRGALFPEPLEHSTAVWFQHPTGRMALLSAFHLLMASLSLLSLCHLSKGYSSLGFNDLISTAFFK